MDLGRKMWENKKCRENIGSAGKWSRTHMYGNMNTDDGDQRNRSRSRAKMGQDVPRYAVCREFLEAIHDYGADLGRFPTLLV